MFSLAEIEQRMNKLRGWSLEGKSLAMELSFGSFKEAIDFVNRVAEISDRKNHHPTIIIEFDKVRLYLTTHEEKGVGEKDFDLAADIDKIKDAMDGLSTEM